LLNTFGDPEKSKTTAKDAALEETRKTWGGDHKKTQVPLRFNSATI